MSPPTMEQLQRLELRDIWMTEVGDFMPWLARQDDLKIPSATLGLKLKLKRQQNIRGFRTRGRPMQRLRIDCLGTKREPALVARNQPLRSAAAVRILDKADRNLMDYSIHIALNNLRTSQSRHTSKQRPNKRRDHGNVTKHQPLLKHSSHSATTRHGVHAGIEMRKRTIVTQRGIPFRRQRTSEC